MIYIMEIFQCPTCNKTFNQKIHLNYHLNKKKACDGNNTVQFINSQKISDDLLVNKCGYCNKQLSRKDVVINHIKNRCKVVKQIEDEKHKIYINLQNEYKKELEEKTNEIENLKEKLKSTTNINNNITTNNITNNNNNNNNSNNTNTINNTINNMVCLVNYSAEDYPELTPEEIRGSVNGFRTLANITELHHFNPRHPEYHNLYVPKRSEGHGMIYRDYNWKTIRKDYLIQDVYDDKIAFMEENKDKYEGKITEGRARAFNSVLEGYDEIATQRTKENIANVLYDNKHLPIETTKKIERAKKQQKKELEMQEKKKLKAIKNKKIE